MKFLKAAVVLLLPTMMILLPTLTDANSMDATNSSLPYCNRTDDRPVTTIDEVCNAIFYGLNEIDDLCSQDGMVGWIITQHSVYIVQVTFCSNAEYSLQGM